MVNEKEIWLDCRREYVVKSVSEKMYDVYEDLPPQLQAQFKKNNPNQTNFHVRYVELE